MWRNIFIALVLAALSLTSANGSPTHSAKTHKSTLSAAASHKKKQHQATHAIRHAARHRQGRTIRPQSTRKHFAPQIRPAHLSTRPATPQKAIEVSAPSRMASLTATPPRWARLAVPPPLFGSRTSLVRQNTKTEADDLERIEDDDDLADRIARKMLVPVPASAKLTVNGSLPQDRRYCRPWTAGFLTDLARAHAAAFHRPLHVSSAVRTVEYQKRLIETNGNAAAAEGDIVSPHVTGSTIDIAKNGLTRQELGWLRRWLLPLQTAGNIDVEEEFLQSCFHITVYKNYLSPTPALKAAQPKVVQPTRGDAPHIASRGR